MRRSREEPGLRPARIDVAHPVRLLPQTEEVTCWEAAAAMLFGGVDRVPEAVKLGAAGAYHVGPSDVAEFAYAHRLRMHRPRRWTVGLIAEMLRRGPLWAGAYLPNGHAFIIGAMLGDGRPDATFLTIYDPRPPEVGGVYKITFGVWMLRYRGERAYILHR